MNAAALAYKGANRQAQCVGAADVLKMATVNGAKALGREGELGVIKEGVKNGGTVDSLMHSQLTYCNSDNTVNIVAQMPDNIQMLLGQMGGSFGEVSAIAILIGAIFLLIRRVISWHIPVSFLLTAFSWTCR